VNSSQDSATALRGDEASLFTEHHQALRRSVKAVVHTSAANIEDACSFAWLQLLRYQPERRQELFAWLRTTAVREAIRLHRANVGQIAPFDLDVAVPDQRMDCLDALEHVAALDERERRIFALHVAGYSYDEIADQTGDSLRTVERLMGRARKAVRR
jgi:RNA polymerase sigma factor (sigma-70 family)